MDNKTNPILRFFVYKDLTPRQQIIGKHYHDLAHGMADVLPRGAEASTALRKLMESRDSAFRAIVDFKKDT